METLRDIMEKYKELYQKKWEEYERMCNEFWLVMRPVLEDAGVIARRYYGKRKAETVNNGEIHTETENDRPENSR